MPTDSTRPLALPHGLAFADLYSIEGAARIDELFAAHLAAADAALADRLDSARRDPGALARKEESDLLIAIGPHLEDFVAALFGSRRKCVRSRRCTTSSRRFTS